MIVVKIEMWPCGSEEKSYVIDEFRVWNDGGPEHACNYVADHAGRRRRLVHDRDLGAFELVAAAMEALRVRDERRGEVSDPPVCGVCWGNALKCGHVTELEALADVVRIELRRDIDRLNAKCWRDWLADDKRGE